MADLGYVAIVVAMAAAVFFVAAGAVCAARGVVARSPGGRDAGLAGYMSWSVPFAFGMAALITGRLDADWIRATRKYALFAWTILGAGNLLGAWWAYHVLGWGGYWGWDPVENAALMPWLVGTAYL